MAALGLTLAAPHVVAAIQANLVVRRYRGDMQLHSAAGAAMIFTLIVGALAVIFDTTIMSVAINSLAGQLHTSILTIQ
jgi:hypothetical protein